MSKTRRSRHIARQRPKGGRWALLTSVLLLSAGLGAEPAHLQVERESSARTTLAEVPSRSPRDRHHEARRQMIENQLVARGIESPSVLAAMGQVPRHEFVRERDREIAYADRPLPIAENQTISQPYIVAIMTQLARVEKNSRVLEIGTGSGYQTAVLSQVAADVYSIEIIESLARGARETLARLGFGNVHLRHGDGYRGWPEAAPFDAILVTAAPETVPQPLLDQLSLGGRLVVPLGRWAQELVVYTRTASGIERQAIIPVRFVPMTGEVQKRATRK